MRSATGTKLLLLVSVVLLTKSIMAFLEGPSFQEGSGLVEATLSVLVASIVGCGSLQLHINAVPVAHSHAATLFFNLITYRLFFEKYLSIKRKQRPSSITEYSRVLPMMAIVSKHQFHLFTPATLHGIHHLLQIKRCRFLPWGIILKCG
jgi:hypothetical protein